MSTDEVVTVRARHLGRSRHPWPAVTRTAVPPGHAGWSRPENSCTSSDRSTDESAIAASLRRWTPPPTPEEYRTGRRQDGAPRGRPQGSRPRATPTSCARGSASSPRRFAELEVTEPTGVSRGICDPEARLTYRNGYRLRPWDTRVGTIELAIPRVRDGSLRREPARFAPAGRAGAPGGRLRGVHRGGQHPPGRRPRPRARDERDQQERGLPDVRRPRRRGQRVPDPLARGRTVPVPPSSSIG